MSLSISAVIAAVLRDLQNVALSGQKAASRIRKVISSSSGRCPTSKLSGQEAASRIRKDRGLTQTQATPTVSVSDIVARSLRTIGFQTIQLPGPGRVVGEDSAGRAMVVEADSGGRLRAELLGTAEGSCVQVMEDFLEALRAEGLEVRVESREWTGGVPRTETGWRWVQQRYPSSSGSKTLAREIRRVLPRRGQSHVR